MLFWQKKSQLFFLSILLLAAFFVVEIKKVEAAFDPAITYSKTNNGQLSADEWNNLQNDFVRTWGSTTAVGGIGIGIAPQGTDINGLVASSTIKTNTSFLGALSAAYVTPGAFNSIAGTGGNFSFPVNLGIGISNPTASLDIRHPENQLVNIRRNSGFDFVQSYLVANSGYGTTGWNDWLPEANISYGAVKGDVLGVIGDSFVIGKNEKFNTISIDIGTAKSTGGTFAWEYSLGGNSWAALTDISDDTNYLSRDGVITFTSPADWATDSQNGSSQLYFVRLRVIGGSFSTEPTIYLVSPSANDIFSLYGNGGDILPTFLVDKYGYASLRNVATFSAIGSISANGTVSAKSFSASSYIQSAVSGSTVNYTPNTLGLHAYSSTGGISGLQPLANSPVIRWSGQAMNGTVSQTNSMDIYLRPTHVNETITGGRLVFRNNAISGAATSDEIMSLDSSGSLEVMGATLGDEVLINNYFTGASTSWDLQGDFNYYSNTLRFLYSSGSAAATQMSTNFATPLKPYTWYKFSYTTVTAGTTATPCYIGTEVSSERTYFRTTTTAIPVYFKTNSNPDNFVIHCSTTGTSGLRLDNLSLREVIGGNIAAHGLFTGGGTDGIKIDKLGNVGIGTTAPGYKLDVNGEANFGIGTTTNRLHNVSAPTYGTDAANKNYVDSVIAPAATTTVGLQSGFWTTGANSSIFNNNTGGVGIGTTNPNLAKFQIEAGNGVVGQYINGGTTVGTDLLKLRANAATQRLILEGAGGTVQTFLEAGGSIGLFGTVTNHDFRIRTNYVDRMTFDTTGNVGIGTTTPNAALDVFGNAKITNAGTVYNANSNYWLRFDETLSDYDSLKVQGDLNSAGVLETTGTTRPNYVMGNLGVGTSNPYYAKLNINTSSLGNNALLAFAVSDGTYNPRAIINYITATDNQYVQFSSSYSTGSGLADWIFLNGNVGIGTTAPTQKLEVAGNIFMNTGYLMQTDTWGMKWKFAGDSDTVEMNSSETAWKFNIAGGGVTKYRFNSSKTGFGPILDLNTSGSSIFYGNVGIGTTTPSAKLTVAGGNIFIADAVITSSTPHAAITKTYLDSALETLSSDLSASTTASNYWLANGANIYNKNTGNVGIGTTNPFLGQLHINKGVAAGLGGDLWITNNAVNTTGNSARLSFGLDNTTDVSSNAFIQAIVTNSSGYLTDLIFGTYGTGGLAERMRINSSGNVGIGNNLNLTAGGIIFNSDSSRWLDMTGTNADSLRLSKNIRLGDAARNVALGLGTNVPNRASLTLNSTAGNPADIIFKNGSATIGNYGQWAISSRNGSSDYRFSIWRGSENGGVSTEREMFTISPSGNVGIGTTAPNNNLQIKTDTDSNGITIQRNSVTAGSYADLSFLMSTTDSGVKTTSGIRAYRVSSGVNTLALRTGGVDAVTILDSGNVGIGTTTPDAKLNVNGNFHVSGAFSSVVFDKLADVSGSRIVMADSSGALYATSTSIATGLPSPSGISGQTLRSNDTNWVANNLLYNNGTNVGINTTAPAGRLHVNDGAVIIDKDYGIRGDAFNSGARNFIWSLSNSFPDRGISYFEGSYDYISIHPGSIASVLAVTDTGKVGIGTTNPLRKLDIIANASQTGLYVENQGNSTYPTAIFKNNQASSYASIDIYGGSAITNSNKFQFGQYAGGDAFFYLVGNNNLDFFTNNTNRIRINGSGNVGIGTTTPNTALDIFGKAKITNNGIIYNTDSSRWLDMTGANADSLRVSGNLITTGGKVGIGTTNPLARLVVKSATSTPNLVLSTSGLLNGDSAALLFHVTTDDYNGTDSHVVAKIQGIRRGAGATGDLAFLTETSDSYVTEKMRILANGNVGVGTTNPTGKFVIKQSGNNWTDGFNLERSATTDKFNFTHDTTGRLLIGYNSVKALGIFSSGISVGSYAATTPPSDGMIIPGKVGIGTTSPSAKLTVAGGNIFITDAAITSSTPHAAITKTYLDSALETLSSDLSASTTASNYWLANGANIYNKNTGNVGIGTDAPAGKLNIARAAGDNLIYADNYSTTAGHSNYWFSRRSHSNTLGSLVTTLTGDALGTFFFQGVNTSNAFAYGARIVAAQNGDAGLYIPTNLIFNTYSATGQNNNQFILSSNGNVGIGTTNPNYALDIGGSGVLNVGGNIIRLSSTKVISTSGSNLLFNAKAPGANVQIVKYTNSAPLVTFQDSGNVGIGTTTPNQKLEVSGGNIFITDASINSGTPHAAITKTYLDSALETYGSKWILNGSNLYASSTAWNVGIGTANPEVSLHVSTPAVTATAETVARFGVADAANSFIAIENASSVNGNYMPSIVGVNGDDQRTGLRFVGKVADATWSGQYYPALTFQAKNRSTDSALTVTPVVSFINGNDVKLATWYDGRTKIGGSDAQNQAGGGLNRPGTMLDVIGGGSDDLLNLIDGATSRFYVQKSGNVGIGTTTPTHKLHVAGDASFMVGTSSPSQIHYVAAPTQGTDAVNRNYVDSNFIASTSLATITKAFVQGGNSFGAKAILGTNDNQALGLETNGTEKMTILANGNVGIGTTNPTSKLHVSTNVWNAGSYIPFATISNLDVNAVDGNVLLVRGGANDSLSKIFEVQDYSGNTDFMVSGAGNVGIGTTTPNTALDIFGKAKITNNGIIYNTDSSRWLDMTGAKLDSIKVPGNILTTGGMLVSDLYNAAQIRLNSAGSNFGKIQSDAANIWSLAYSTASSSALGTPALSWNSAGNVGIGTTNPGTFKLNVVGDAQVNNMTFANPGFGVESRLTFSKLTDAAWISVNEKSYDTTEYSFNMSDNPDQPGDMFYWKMSDWQGTGGAWRPLQFNGVNAQIAAANINAYGNYNVYGPWYSSDGVPNTIYSVKTGSINLTPNTAGYTGTTGVYWFKIDGTGSPNTFSWGRGYTGSVAVATGVPVSTSPVTIESGLTVTFSATTGGAINDLWQFRVYSGGNMRVANGSASLPSISFTGDTNTGMYLNGADQLAFATGGANRMTVSSGGNVGIGTTTPSTKLYVNGVVTATGGFSGPLTGTVNAANISKGIFGTNTGQGTYHFGGTTISGDAHFQWNGATYRNPGTYTPQINIRQDNASTGINSFQPALSLYNNNGSLDSTIGLDFVSREAAGAGNAVALAGIMAIKESVGTDNGWSQGGLLFYTKNFGERIDALRILNNGNVGIGVDPGAFKLKVAGNVAITGTLQTMTGSDFAEEFTVSSPLEAGTVVVMGDLGYKSVKACGEKFDSTVVGVVSDNPSIIAGRVDSKHKVVVAMAGVVKVKVSDVNGKIKKGTMLTTSNISGYAMKADSAHPGTIIGKALENLSGQQGEIKVLINLQ